MGEYGGLGLFFFLVLIFPFLFLAPARILQPRQPTPEKQKPYECGVDTVGSSDVQYHVGYFRYALAFLLLVGEAVFLYPWAVSFNRLCLFAFMEMLVFLGILALGLWYAWKKGDLAWK